MNESPATRPSLLESGRVIYTLLGLVILALWIPRFHGPIDLRWDGGAYYVLGTSIAEGKGYRLLNEPGEIRANQYPPLFPVIIAAHQIALGTNDPVVVGRALRLTSFVAFATYIIAVYVLLGRHLSSGFALFGTVVCLLNVHTYFLSDLCFPDMLYAVLTVGFLLALSNESRHSTAPLAGVFAVAGFAARTAGLALLATWVGEALLKREWRTALGRAACALIPIVAWFSYVHDVEMSAEYKNPAYAYQRADYMFYNVSYARNTSLIEPFDPDLGYATPLNRVERFFSRAAGMTRHFGESVSSQRRVWEAEWEVISNRWSAARSEWIIDVPLVALGILVLLGTALLILQRKTIIPSCILLSVVVVCLTPWPEQLNRYLMPIVPILALSLCLAIMRLLDLSLQVREVRWRGMIRLFVCMVMLGIGTQLVVSVAWNYTKGSGPVQYLTRQGEKISYRLFFYTGAHRALDAGVDWVMARARPTDVIAGSMPHWMYLRTKLKAVMPPFESDPIKAQALLDSVPVTYLFLDEGLAIDTKRYMAAVVHQFGDRWERVYVDAIIPERPEEPIGQFEIYRRIGKPPMSTDSMKYRPVAARVYQ